MKEHSRMIKTKFWSDTYIQNLEPLAKYLYLYCLTNPLTNVAGCYEITLKRISFDTGLPDTVCIGYFEKFQKDNKMLFSDNWLSIRNFAKHQNFESQKVKKGIENQIEFAPEAHKVYIGYRYGMHTVREVEVELEVNKKGNIELEKERIVKERETAETSTPASAFDNQVKIKTLAAQLIKTIPKDDESFETKRQRAVRQVETLMAAEKLN